MGITEFIKDNVPFLSGLNDDQARFLAQHVEQRRFGKGQTVLFKGVSVEGLHVVAEGKVSVYIKPPRAAESVRVAELGPGEVFGEMSIVEFAMAGATIKCEQDGTLIFVIPQDAFRTVLDQDQGFKDRTLALIDRRRKAPEGSVKPG